MASGFGNPRDNRQSLLSTIMLAALLVSVGAAWLVMQPAARLTKAGREVLADLHEKGLAAYWPRQEVDIWMLARSGEGEILGWQNFTRRPLPAGYAGTLLMAGAATAVSRESWRVSADATSSRYESTTRTTAGRIDIVIALKDGTVTVARPTVSGKRHTSPAPDNYIPEGLNHLVYWRTARNGKRARYYMVFNDSATVRDAVNFKPVVLTPEGRGRLRLTRPGADEGLLFSFDAEGLVETIENTASQVVYRRATAEQVLSHFPEARLLRPDLQPEQSPS